jgi:hypothetical protein
LFCEKVINLINYLSKHIFLFFVRLDSQTTIAHLDNHNIRWTSVLSPATGGGKVRTFLDPEGNILQLIQR